MSSFVRRFGVALGGEGEPDEVREQPAWLGPPEDELGVATPLGVVVGRSGQGTVAITHGMSFTTGLTLSFVAQARGLSRRTVQMLFHEQHPFGMGEEDLPDGFLRLGVELPGGAKASNLGGRPPFGKDDAEAPVFIHRGGSSGQSGRDRVTMSHEYWLWPLPEPGAIRVCANGRWSGSPSRRPRSTAPPSSRRQRACFRSGPALDPAPRRA